MEFVDPIRREKDIQKMKDYFYENDMRSYAMFVVGINVVLRISDLLSIKWKDVIDEYGNIKNLKIREKKTKKHREIKLNKNVIQALKEYKKTIKHFDRNNYIFLSQKGENKPISRTSANRILKNAAKKLKIKGNIGTHSLRKTWGYQAWKRGVPLALIMTVFNHYNIRVTKLYLGIIQDDINEVYNTVNI